MFEKYSMGVINLESSRPGEMTFVFYFFRN